jgi:glycosyltransferase involved in cell wall biosynthesis
MDPTHGGPSQGIRNSIPELEKRNVRNEVVCLDDPASLFLGQDTFPIHALGPSKGPLNYSARLIPWLLKNLGCFDVVIVHGLWLYHSDAVRRALRTYRQKLLNHESNGHKVPKVYIMPHGMLDPYFQKAPSRRLKAMRNWAYWKLIECKVISQADGVLFTCEEELRLARQAFWPYTPQREINIGYGIAEPMPLQPAMQTAFLDKCPGLLSRPYILFLSRIHEKKGVDLLIKAYLAEIQKGTVIKKQGSEDFLENRATILSPECDTSQELPVLVIAGPGLESAYGKRMQELAAELPAATVLFPGMLSGAAKWGAFYGCEAFVLPSHQENFGIAVVEALACSKPVLISNQVNIWREIEAAGAGIIADDTLAGTQQLLARWLQLSSTQRQTMAQQAQKAYRTHFAVSIAAEKMAAALQ